MEYIKNEYFIENIKKNCVGEYTKIKNIKKW